MLTALKIIIFITAALLLQVTILPSYLADPFKPNLLIIAVTYLGLKTGRGGGLVAFALGLLQDCFSGIYMGLNGFSFLSIYLILNMAADRLYTDSRYLMLFVVFLATIVNGLLHLLLLLVFPTATGIYMTILAALIPQALVNTLFSSLLFSLPLLNAIEESR
jgi:rod shape-determining protein MreD